MFVACILQLKKQITYRFFPLCRRIVLRTKLPDSPVNGLTIRKKAQIREVVTPYQRLQILQKLFILPHATHHLDRMRP